jgi:hypothetical protein
MIEEPELWLRWELCKIWKCKVDDPIFSDISGPQWIWYSEMIAQEKKREFNKELAFTEYLASFWNHKAVKNIQEARENDKQHTFDDDQKFENKILSGAYKDDPLVKAIQKLNNNKELNNKPTKDKSATDLSTLSGMIKKF